jgi:hypothetical protein
MVLTLPRGDLRLLQSDVARELLTSIVPARFAYVASDAARGANLVPLDR